MTDFFRSPIQWSKKNPLQCAAGVAGVAATGYLLSKIGLLAPIVSVVCAIFGSLIGSIGGVLLLAFAAVGYIWSQQGDANTSFSPPNSVQQ